MNQPNVIFNWIREVFTERNSSLSNVKMKCKQTLLVKSSEIPPIFTHIFDWVASQVFASCFLESMTELLDLISKPFTSMYPLCTFYVPSMYLPFATNFYFQYDVKVVFNNVGWIFDKAS